MSGWLEKLIGQLESSPVWRYWQQLPSRDRLALSLLTGFLLIVLFYLVIWSPVRNYRADALQEYDRQRELFHYIQTHAEAGRRQKGKTIERLAPQQLQGVVTATAQTRGLVLERFDREGDNGLLVSLSQAPFDKLLLWLNDLQGKGVILHEVNLDRAATGQVNVRMTLMAE